MKRIPAGLLLLTLAFTAPVLPRLHADESAGQLSNQLFGPGQSTTDESAGQLEKQQLGPDQSMQDESAGQLQLQNLGPDQSMQDESASQLSNQDLGPDQSMKDESAKKLAEKEGLEKKPKQTGTQPNGQPIDQNAPAGNGDGVSGNIYAMVAQADGSVIIGGRFDSVNGQPRANLARFKSDGTLDPNFPSGPTGGVTGTVYALAIGASGNILVGGYFTTQQQPSLQNFVSYSAAGAVNGNFNGGQFPNGTVYAIAVLPKGGVVIGGEFTQVGDAMRRNVARFKADGTLAGTVTSINDPTTGAVRSLAALPNGGIIAGGKFQVAGGDIRNILTTGKP